MVSLVTANLEFPKKEKKNICILSGGGVARRMLWVGWEATWMGGHIDRRLTSSSAAPGLSIFRPPATPSHPREINDAGLMAKVIFNLLMNAICSYAVLLYTVMSVNSNTNKGALADPREINDASLMAKGERIVEDSFRPDSALTLSCLLMYHCIRFIFNNDNVFKIPGPTYTQKYFSFFLEKIPPLDVYTTRTGV
ncbi:hypothetical protein J6590_015606 [Homalodisca vitripennis]|nr:hypothetical protein J6590_015606 [Homalodisca vitripennis]